MKNDSPITKALRILQFIATREQPSSLAQLSAELRIPKPSVHRIAGILEHGGFVRKDQATRQFQVGGVFHDMCITAIRNTGEHGERQALLDQLSATLRETINLGILSGHQIVYIERVESSWPLRMDFDPGSRFPAYCTATGKLLLAFAPAVSRDRIINATPLRPYTPNTITDRAVLDRELAKIRRRGYSEDNEEFLAGVCCIAVPVSDGRKRTVFGLAVSAPSARFPLKKARQHLPDLFACAEQLSQLSAGSFGSARSLTRRS
jgi:DNA-binding IclR family transcriptional regulator